ncbi:hypothetical protein [Sphingomonas sp. dw_22]|uniref:hypothetical protein n=1 Tax=Sphingomonas sp. dw_22 TaxID=2721175 RepID=UPI001BD43121|nr:hypothetical protein [Sphingomonas sp. dw_22]
MLETLDGQSGAAGVVAVPDFSVDLWIQRWNPVVYGVKCEEAEKLIKDPVIEDALKSITLQSNIGYKCSLNVHRIRKQRPAEKSRSRLGAFKRVFGQKCGPQTEVLAPAT